MKRLLLVFVLLAVSNLSSVNANSLSRVANKITSPIVGKVFKHTAILGTAALLSLSTPNATLAENIASSSNLAEQVQQSQVQQSTAEATELFKAAITAKDVARLRKVLAAQGVDINAKLFEGRTALQGIINYGRFWASREQIEMIELLLANGADPFIKDQDGLNILDSISDDHGYDGHERDAALAVLVKHVYGINGVDSKGRSPLQYALYFAEYADEIWLARKLVAEGANVRAIKDMDLSDRDIGDYHTTDYETLEDAVKLVTNGQDFLSLAHEAGGIERAVRHVGEFLLKRAVAYGNLAVAKVLVENGVNPTAALHEASVRSGRGGTVVPTIHDPSSAVLEYLLAQGADPNKDIRDGFSPLHLAASTGNYKGLEALLATSNVIVNVVDKNGWTALHHAVADTRTGGFYAVKKFAMVNMLLANGAHANTKNNDGLTPYDYVLRSFSPNTSKARHQISNTVIGSATAALLLKSTEDGKDAQERTALYWAAVSDLTTIKELVKEEKAYLYGTKLHDYMEVLNSKIKTWNDSYWQ